MHRAFKVDYLVLEQFFSLTRTLGLDELFHLDQSPSSSQTSLGQPPSPLTHMSPPSKQPVSELSLPSSSSHPPSSSTSTQPLLIADKLTSLQASSSQPEKTSCGLSPQTGTSASSSSQPDLEFQSSPLRHNSSAEPSGQFEHAALLQADTHHPAEVLPVEEPQDGPHEEHLEHDVVVEPSVNICPVCLTKVDARSFKRHKLQCEEQLPPPCNFCGKQLNRHDNLQRHIKERCTR